MQDDKSIKVTAELASGSMDISGQRFSENALRQLVDQSKGMSIHQEFDHRITVGKVNSAELLDAKRVSISAIISREFISQANPQYIVPCFRPIVVAEEQSDTGSVTVFTDIEVLALGLTIQPTDQSIKPLIEPD